MKKRIISAMAILALLFGPVCIPQSPAQILLMDEEEEGWTYRPSSDEMDLPIIPQLGITLDQYAPLGSGTIVIGLLGGAYLICKRRKDEEN